MKQATEKDREMCRREGRETDRQREREREREYQSSVSRDKS